MGDEGNDWVTHFCDLCRIILGVLPNTLDANLRSVEGPFVHITGLNFPRREADGRFPETETKDWSAVALESSPSGGIIGLFTLRQEGHGVVYCVTGGRVNPGGHIVANRAEDDERKHNASCESIPKSVMRNLNKLRREKAGEGWRSPCRPKNHWKKNRVQDPGERIENESYIITQLHQPLPSPSSPTRSVLGSIIVV